jgi:ankyrin repeat protein
MLNNNPKDFIMPKRGYVYWIGITFFCLLIIAFLLYLRTGSQPYKGSDEIPFYLSSIDAPKLIRAAVYGDTKEVQRLIKAGALLDEEILGWTALHAAIFYEHPDAARALINAGASLDRTNVDGYTALGAAVSRTNIPVTKMLLDAGARVFPDGSGLSPFLLAIQKGSPELARLLLQSGAKTTERDQAGNDALLLAAFGGRIDIYDYLIACGMSPDVRNAQGMNALALAAEGRRVAMTEYLLQSGEEISITDNTGRSALHWAVIGGHPVVVSMLFDAGIDAQIRARNGQRALDLAREQNYMLYEMMAER